MTLIHCSLCSIPAALPSCSPASQSNSQIVAQRAMLGDLGYTLLYESVSNKLAALTAKISFGPDLPYHADWTAIYVKPIRAYEADAETCKKRMREKEGKIVLPLTVRTAPTQMGNVYHA
jgi:hypothetical protein